MREQRKAEYNRLGTPTYPARGIGFQIPCPECQEAQILGSAPDVGVYQKGKRGKHVMVRAEKPLHITNLSAARGCLLCKGRGSIPRESLLDPYEQEIETKAENITQIDVENRIHNLSGRRIHNEKELRRLFALRRLFLFGGGKRDGK